MRVCTVHMRMLGCVYEYVHIHSAKKRLWAKTILRNPTLNLSHE